MAELVKGKSFEAWLAAVDALAWAKVGLSVDDLSDWASYDSWEDGLSPAAGLRAALRASE